MAPRQRRACLPRVYTTLLTGTGNSTFPADPLHQWGVYSGAPDTHDPGEKSNVHPDNRPLDRKKRNYQRILGGVTTLTKY